MPRGRCRLAGGRRGGRFREKDERYMLRRPRGGRGDGWERPGWWRIGERAEARVRRPSVIKARQELRRDERTTAPEDTARDLCDSDIQPASIAEPQKRFSAYRLVTSRPPTDIARPISKHHCGVEIGEIYVPMSKLFSTRKERTWKQVLVLYLDKLIVRHEDLYLDDLF